MSTNYDHSDLTLSRGDLAALRDLLQEQRVRRLDIVTGSTPLSYENGLLRIRGDEQAVTDEGVTSIGGWYRPTKIFDESLATRFGIPAGYLRFLREQGRLELLDDTVNHFFHGSRALRPLRELKDGQDPHVNPPLGGNFMLRLFTADETGGGIARTVVSDRYNSLLDNLDVLVAAISGMQEAGLGPDAITRCDLTERRMFVQVSSPKIRALAPELLKGYRSPFTGKRGDDNPVVFAGFVITNSEFGDAAASVVPRITVLACGNGATFSKDAERMIHIGARQSEGIVRYSEETRQRELAYAQSRVKDAVTTFMDTDYVKAKIRELEEQAGTEISKPEETVKQVVQAAGIPAGLANDVLSNFIKGGQLTAAGVMQAVTATAQTVESADLAYTLEDKATEVLRQAARLA